MVNNYYRICGLYYEEPPWGETNDLPLFEFCDCCGVEFGYQDYEINSIRKFRTNWLNNGAIWFLPEYKPQNWDLNEQLKSIPDEYQ